MQDILKQIKELDRATAPRGRRTPFPLKKAAASRVATLITNFYAQRYPMKQPAQHQVRVTYDDSSNTVFVQAAPADLEEIRGLISRIDNTVSSAVNELRIVPLKNVLSDELAPILNQAINEGIVVPTATTTPGVVPTAPAGLVPGARPGGVGGLPGTGGPTAGATGQAGTTGTATKTTSLRFLSARPGAPGTVESGLLEDIHITSDTRINSLIIAAPSKSMDLILALIGELDVLPALRAEMNIFALHKADATAMAQMLQQLFLGASSTGTTPGTGQSGTSGTGGLPGAGGFPGSSGLPGAGGTPSTQVPGSTSSTPRQLTPLSLAGTPQVGVPLIELRITVDQRTNSLIVAGSRNDLDIIEALVSRLEDADVQVRHNEVYQPAELGGSRRGQGP